MHGRIHRENRLVAVCHQPRHRLWRRAVLGYVRHAATLVAWLAALQAFALMSKHGG
jgi:hypothetical protein